ncbi:Hypothetical predicted protein [Cloeon dipterum]|uniref:C-type lectin domain-containing protein n=1 Tax=Cloeon dipterum TaxID=197152 RepID=A0A8S1BXV4_9INSE|nr:Hypothetical predicted protein [Cloeon dipterum]
MKSLFVIVFCSILVIVAITLADAQKKSNKSPGKNIQQNKSAGKKNGAGRVVKKRSTRKPSTKKGKTGPELKTTRQSGSTVSKSTTPFNEDAPDNEAGFNCYDSCHSNPTSFNNMGKIKNLDEIGKLVPSPSEGSNGKVFLVGRVFKSSWEEHWKLCCSIGMQPLFFTDGTKMLEFTIAASQLQIGHEETTFWTGGFMHENYNAWSWCTKDSPRPIDLGMLTDIKYLENGEDINCIAIFVGTDGQYMSNVLCNTNGTNTTMPLVACESVNKRPTVMKSGCAGTPCNINRQCKRNEYLTKFVKKGENLSLKRYTYGRWLSRCGKYILFSTGSTTYDDARERCCALGMQLLSVKTAAKRNCLSKLATDFNDVVGEFWTSGTDLDCDGNYRWCSVDRAFVKSEVLWAAGEPNRKKGLCVTIKTNSNETDTTLQTSDCNAKKRYICEARQPGTLVKVVQKECVAILGLIKEEVVGLIDDMVKYTYNMCYLKCVGDNLNMLLNGNLQDFNTMRLSLSGKLKLSIFAKLK